MGKLSKQQKIEMAGFAIATIGIMLPAYSAPIIGGVSLISRGEGWFLLPFLLGGFLSAFKDSPFGVKLASIVCLVMLAAFIGLFYFQLGQMRSDLAAEMAGNPFGGLAQAMVSTVKLSWAWIPLFLGSALPLFSQAIADEI